MARVSVDRSSGIVGQQRSMLGWPGMEKGMVKGKSKSSAMEWVTNIG